VEFGLSLTPASLRASDGGVDPAKISALILQVKELLPDLHESFIQVSLRLHVSTFILMKCRASITTLRLLWLGLLEALRLQPGSRYQRCIRRQFTASLKRR
jgi:hypothetical protein